MNYIDPRFDSSPPGGGSFVIAPHDRPSLLVTDASDGVNWRQVVSARDDEIEALAAQLERANQTADFLAASGDALRMENGELRAYIAKVNEVMLNQANGESPIILTRSAIDKAPPSVQDWLKAFGVYEDGYRPKIPASEPEKPSDPRSETLGRALVSRIHGGSPGLPPFDE